MIWITFRRRFCFQAPVIHAGVDGVRALCGAPVGCEQGPVPPVMVGGVFPSRGRPLFL